MFHILFHLIYAIDFLANLVCHYYSIGKVLNYIKIPYLPNSLYLYVSPCASSFILLMDSIKSRCSPKKEGNIYKDCNRAMAWLVSGVLIHQICRFDPQSGPMQESTNECLNKWNNKLVSPSQTINKNLINEKLQ